MHRTDQIPDVLSSDDAPNSWQLPCLRDVDSPDARVRMGRTQDRGEAESGNWRQIVNEASLPSQERLILFARNRRAYPSLRCGRSCSQDTVNHRKAPARRVPSSHAIYRASLAVVPNNN
jgi:hypothetical protein